MNEIFTALKNFEKAGYEKVSVSELAYNTKLPRHTILAQLQKRNVKTIEIMNEVYVILRIPAPAIQAHLLRAPKHSFEVDTP